MMRGHNNSSSLPSKKKLDTVLHMNPGHDRNSYARNSTLQRNVMVKTMPLVQNRVRALYGKAFPKCFVAADLGCSSGPNSVLAISRIIEAIMGLCSHTGNPPPEFLVFLNDLPQNDFNSVFTSLPSFYEKLAEKNRLSKSNCFISAMPGSFHDRLFPSRSLHFVHSSYSVHWLSQVPEFPEKNKGSIYMASTSPPSVFKAYLQQFQRDFTHFLSSRAHEIVPGGEMVLTLLGRSIPDPTSKDCCLLYWCLARSVFEMAKEGLIKDEDIDSFNLPFYTPCREELRDVVEEEGSFTINCIKTFQVNWDPFYHDEEDAENNCVFDKSTSGQNVAHCIRSVAEPTLRNHFGEALMMDSVFERFARLVGEHLAAEKTKRFNIVICMTRKLC